MIFKFKIAKKRSFGKLKTVLVINDLIVIETQQKYRFRSFSFHFQEIGFKYSELGGFNFTFRHSIERTIEHIKNDDPILYEIIYEDKEKKIIKKLHEKIC